MSSPHTVCITCVGGLLALSRMAVAPHSFWSLLVEFTDPILLVVRRALWRGFASCLS